ncbi:MAG TPA: CbiX/SirB N-terminal domain-containing protein [Polyangia bacterium]|nr:CbiX/SirB N-terminal domain-containing protein [Polyangia bacterium]
MTATSSRVAVLILGHGSRDAGANAEFEALVARYAARRPDLLIGHAYVELAAPSLADGLASLAAEVGPAGEVTVLPLFLFAAGHVKNDLPLALATARARFPLVRFSAAPALGVHATLVGLAAARALQALADRAPAARAALVVIGRGASDPDANGDFCKVVRLVGEGQPFAWVAPAFIGIARPLFEEVVELLSRTRPAAIVAVPYFLFAGRLLDKLAVQAAAFRARTPWVPLLLAPPLGAADPLLVLIDERIAQARGGGAPLPCDTCQYRVPISGVAGKVGGLKALLWSVRHLETHSQAMPHAHAHASLAKHVLVCANADCADRGSLGLLSSLRRLVERAGRQRDIRVTRTGCMGRCGEGPTVAVYPDGIWYRQVAESDAPELVREHLLSDRLVARLVDNIMQ